MCEDFGGCIFLCKNYSVLTGQNEFPENKIRTAQFKWLHHNDLTSKDKTIKVLILI